MLIIHISDFRQSTKKTTTQWSSILHLAEKWGFENLTLLAIDNLIVHASPIDKIVLGRRYGIKEWLPAAFEAVCTRADPLTVEEGTKLGMEDTVRIAAARQLYGTGKARHHTEYLSGDLGQIFELVRPLDGSAEVDDGTEVNLKVSEEQFADAQSDYQNHSNKDLDMLIGCASNGGGKHNWYNKSHRPSSSCWDCQARGESDEEKRKKVKMEEIERQLPNLRSKLETKRRNRIGRKERMASFK